MGVNAGKSSPTWNGLQLAVGGSSERGTSVPKGQIVARERKAHELSRITNAPVSSTFIVYARTSKDGPPSKGITAFLVERKWKGFEVGEGLDKFGVSLTV